MDSVFNSFLFSSYAEESSGHRSLMCSGRRRPPVAAARPCAPALLEDAEQERGLLQVGRSLFLSLLQVAA
jgi:hypothetical protein